ncbi:MAG: hypothetical protein NC124_15150, partial [Clostridium sp.]|nr:hypothetical protein [Clostridium sp.]
MTAVFCRNEQSVGQLFRQTTDADRQTVFTDGKHCLRSASVGAKRMSTGHPAPSESALLLIRMCQK